MEKHQNRKRFHRLIAILLFIFSIGVASGISAGYEITSSEAKEAKGEPSTETTTEISEPTPTCYDCPLPEMLQLYISVQCEDRNVPMPLVLAVIEKESSFKADAVSDTDDYGLMQINKTNHERFINEYGITDFLDPYQNVFCGITLLSEHYARYEDIDMALMAYNLGIDGAKQLWNIGIYQTDYTEQVRASIEAYEGVTK